MDLSQFEQIERDVQDVRFGTINIYMHLEDSENLIMEKYRRSASLEDHRFNCMQAEQRKKLQHECLLRLICMQHNETTWISQSFFEYPNEDLFDRRDQLRNPVEIVKFLRDTLAALTYMQEQRFIHGDLRPEYIFYDHKRKKYILLDRLGDPSDSIEVQINNLLYEERQIYMSPLLFREVSEGNRKFKHRPFKSDTFSLGMVLISLFIDESDYANCYNRMGRVFDYDHFGLLKEFVRETIFVTESESILADFIFVCLANPNESQRLDPAKALGTLEKTIVDLFIKEERMSFEGKVEVKSSEFLTDTVKSSEVVEITKGWGSSERASEDGPGRRGSLDVKIEDFKKLDLGEERGKRKSVLGVKGEGEGEEKEEEEREGGKRNQEGLVGEISEEAKEQALEESNEIFESKVEFEDSQIMKAETQQPEKSEHEIEKDEDFGENPPTPSENEESSLPVSKLSEESDYQLEDTVVDADSEIEAGFEKIDKDEESGILEDLDETLYASVSRLDEKVNNLNDIYHQNIQNLHSFLMNQQNEKDKGGSQIEGGSTFTDRQRKSTGGTSGVSGTFDMKSDPVTKDLVQRSLTKVATGTDKDSSQTPTSQHDLTQIQRIASLGHLAKHPSIVSSKPRIFRGNSIDSFQKVKMHQYKGPHDEYLIDIDQTALGRILAQADGSSSNHNMGTSVNSGGEFNDDVNDLNYFSYRAEQPDNVPAVLSPKHLSPGNLKNQLERKRKEVNNARSLDFNNLEGEIGGEPQQRRQNGFRMDMMTTGFSMSNPQFLRGAKGESPDVRGRERGVVFKFLESESRASAEIKSRSLDSGNGLLKAKNGRNSHHVTSLSHFSQSFQNSKGGDIDQEEEDPHQAKPAKPRSMRAQTSIEETNFGKLKRNSFQPEFIQYSEGQEHEIADVVISSNQENGVEEIPLILEQFSDKVVLQGIVENYMDSLKAGLRFNLERQFTTETLESESISIEQTDASKTVIINDLVENYMDSLKSSVKLNLKSMDTFKSRESQDPVEATTHSPGSQHVIVKDIVEHYLDSLKANVKFNLQTFEGSSDPSQLSNSTGEGLSTDEQEIEDIKERVHEILTANESMFQTYEGTCGEEEDEELSERDRWWVLMKSRGNLEYLVGNACFNLYENDGSDWVDRDSQISRASSNMSGQEVNSSEREDTSTSLGMALKKSIFSKKKSNLPEIGEENHRESVNPFREAIKKQNSSSGKNIKASGIKKSDNLDLSYDMTFSDVGGRTQSDEVMVENGHQSSRPRQYETEKYSEGDFITETKKSDFISSKNTSTLNFSHSEKKQFTRSMELQGFESNRLRDSIKSETPRLRFKESGSHPTKSKEDMVVNLAGHDRGKRSQHLIVGIDGRQMLDDGGTVGRLNIQEFATEGKGPGFAKIQNKNIASEIYGDDIRSSDFIAIEGIDELASMGPETIRECEQNESLETKMEPKNVTSIQSEECNSEKLEKYFESSEIMKSKENLQRANTLPTPILKSSEESNHSSDSDEIEQIKNNLKNQENHDARISESSDDDSVVNSYEENAGGLEIDIIDGFSDRNIEMEAELEEIKSESGGRWKVSKSVDGIVAITEVTEDSRTRDHSEIYTNSNSAKKSSGENNRTEKSGSKKNAKRPVKIAKLKYRFSEGQMPIIELGSLNFRKSPRISSQEQRQGQFKYEIEEKKNQQSKTKSLINEGNNFWSNPNSLSLSNASSELEGKKKSSVNKTTKTEKVTKSAIQLDSIPSFGDEELLMRNIKEEEGEGDGEGDETGREEPLQIFGGKKLIEREALDDLENLDPHLVARESEFAQETDESEVKIIIKYQEKQAEIDPEIENLVAGSRTSAKVGAKMKDVSESEDREQLQESMARGKNLISVSNFSNSDELGNETRDFIKAEMEKDEDESEPSDSDENFVEDETGSGYYLNEKQLRELETQNLFVCSEMQTRSVPFSIDEMEMKEIQMKKWERFHKKNSELGHSKEPEFLDMASELQNQEIQEFKNRFGNDFGDDSEEEEGRFTELRESEMIDLESESELENVDQVDMSESLYELRGSYDEDTDESIHLREEGVALPDSVRESEAHQEKVQSETQKSGEDEMESESESDGHSTDDEKLPTDSETELQQDEQQSETPHANQILESEMLDQIDTQYPDSTTSSQKKVLYAHKKKNSGDMGRRSSGINREDWDQPSPKSSYLTIGDITVSNEPMMDREEDDSMFQNTLQESGMLDSEIGRLKFIVGGKPGKVPVREEYQESEQVNADKLRRSDNLFVKKKGIKRVNVSVEGLGKVGEEDRQDIIEYSQSLTNNLVPEDPQKEAEIDLAGQEVPKGDSENLNSAARIRDTLEARANHNTEESNESEQDSKIVPSKEQNEVQNQNVIEPDNLENLGETNASGSDLEYASVQTQQKYTVNQANPQKRAAIKVQEALNRMPTQSQSRNQVVVVERNRLPQTQEAEPTQQTAVPPQPTQITTTLPVQINIITKLTKRNNQNKTAPRLFSNTAAHKRLRAKRNTTENRAHVTGSLAERTIYESRIEKATPSENEVIKQRIETVESSGPKYKSLINALNSQDKVDQKRYSELREEERDKAMRQMEMSMDQRLTMNSSIQRIPLSRTSSNPPNGRFGIQDSTIVLQKDKLLSVAVDSRVAGVSLDNKSRARSNMTKRSVVTFVNAFDIEAMSDSIHMTPNQYKKYSSQLEAPRTLLKPKYKVDSVKIVNKRTFFGTKVKPVEIKPTVSLGMPSRVRRRIVYRSVSPVREAANTKSHKVARPRDEYGLGANECGREQRVMSRNKSYEVKRERDVRTPKKGTVVMVVRKSSPFRGRKEVDRPNSSLTASKLSGNVERKPPPDFIKKNIQYVRALSKSQREIREKSQKSRKSGRLDVSRSSSRKPQAVTTSVKRKSYREIYLEKKSKRTPQVVRKYQTKIENTPNSGKMRNKQDYKKKYGIKRERGRRSGAREEVKQLVSHVRVERQVKRNPSDLGARSRSRVKPNGVSEIDRISDNINRSKSPVQYKKKIVPKMGRKRELKKTRAKGELTQRKYGARRYRY